MSVHIQGLGLGAAPTPWAGMLELRELGCSGAGQGLIPHTMGTHSAARGFPTPEFIPVLSLCLLTTPRAEAKADPGGRQLFMRASFEGFLPPLSSALEPGPAA